MSPKPKLRRCRALALLWCALAAPAARAAVDLTQLSLEDLAHAEVYGVSRVQERLLNTPASVTVMTADDIRSFGYRTLGELIHGQRGFFMFTDRAYQYAGTRGFGPPGDYNTRMLVLVDGLRANDNIYDQAPLGTEGIVDLELVERVELIRGPVSSMHGSNALFGVINVITRKPAGGGAAVQVQAGSGKDRTAAAQGSAELMPGVLLLLRASQRKADGRDIVQPALAQSPTGAVARDVDGLDLTRFFARVRGPSWDLTLLHNDRVKHSGFGLYGSDFNDPQAFANETFDGLQARWERALSGAVTLALDAYGGRYTYVDRFNFSGEAIVSDIVGQWYGVDVQGTLRLAAGHRLVLGAETQRDNKQQLKAGTEADPALYVDTARSSARTALFVQHDADWLPMFSTSAGLRLDRYTERSTRTSPRVAAIYKPSERLAAKLLYGTAFRVPSTYERDYSFTGYQAVAEGLRDERVQTQELLIEAEPASGRRLSMSVYRYTARDLITLLEDAQGLRQFQNRGSARATGFEIEGQQQLSSLARLRGTWSTQRAEDENGIRLVNSPRHVARADLTFDWAAVNSRLGSDIVYVGSRLSTSGRAVASYHSANLTLSTLREIRGVSASASVRNLFDRGQVDPVELVPGFPELDRVPLPERSFWVQLGYRF